eukprot:gene5326-6642_t
MTHISNSLGQEGRPSCMEGFTTRLVTLFIVINSSIIIITTHYSLLITHYSLPLPYSTLRCGSSTTTTTLNNNTPSKFIKNGVNKRLYIGASQKLGVSVDQVEHIVEGLTFLFTECSRFMLNEHEFIDSLSPLKFDQDLVNHLKDIYFSNRKDVRTILQEFYPNFDHYLNLEWRLDTQIANRSLGQSINPIFLLKLKTQSGSGVGNTKENILQTDPTNLKHICTELESALLEIRNYENRIIMRNIK